jgi:hypothetical protein
VRYCDDFVIVCYRQSQVIEAKRRVEAVLAELGLRLHPDKTRIVRLTAGEAGFDFLGFHHRMVASWKWPGRWYLQRWPSDRAMNSIRTKIRQRTDRRLVGMNIETIVTGINPVLRGWGNYFRRGNSARKFNHIDNYVDLRLARFASIKYGLPGRNWCGRFDHRWATATGVHRLTGTVLGAAYARR